MEPERRGGGDRWANLAFALALVIAVPVIMYHGREQWFFLDEWDFLAGRDGGSLDDLLRPHNEHWSLIPIIVWRTLFRIVGLHHYWPYQSVVVVAHLTSAALLRAVMRRAGAHVWVATAATVLFAFLGSGRQNIEYAFQIGFTGSLVCGLAHLILADHDGEIDRRDALGLVFGLAGLLCSGVGVTMTVVVGAATLIRRGWRAAVIHTAPLGAIFLIWFVSYGRDTYGEATATPSEATTFIRTAVANVFGGLGQVPGFGPLLAVILVVGAALIVKDTTNHDLRSRLGPAAGLLVGAGVFVTITGFGRAGADLFGTMGAPRSSRYVHLIGAMILPGIALGASHLAQRWRLRVPVAVTVAAALFLIGLPGNVEALRPGGVDRFTLGSPDTILTLAVLPETRTAARDLHPLPFEAAEVTVGWLVEAEDAGRLPDPPAASPATIGNAKLALSLRQIDEVSKGECRPVAPNTIVRLREGQEVVLPEGGNGVRRIVRGREVGGVGYFVTRSSGHGLRVESGPIEIRLQPSTPGARARVCA